ncbi:phiSA1p31-related protein [Streptomyces sp. OUCMDZ-4982]|uniref:phiSA1p31-related protein n=1 Tax=Streptomyces sp. OUCMDZ-4982 TaxID=2973090 RepID=UPI00215B971D|nr:phiSA1p31-related protein [Streptomyces sp. OUCMDZ-4982]MCR8946591.1 phiSA1p31-related protein [Streptomyces sp. OUCMDZ-4982]
MTTHLLTTWLLDGVEIDLTRTQLDVYGNQWDFTGATTEDGEPLMQSGEDGPLPLPEVYHVYGPLIPAARPVTHTECLAAITVCPAETDTKVAPSPSTFAALLGRLRRRATA